MKKAISSTIVVLVAVAVTLVGAGCSQSNVAGPSEAIKAPAGPSEVGTATAADHEGWHPRSYWYPSHFNHDGQVVVLLVKNRTGVPQQIVLANYGTRPDGSQFLFGSGAEWIPSDNDWHEVRAVRPAQCPYTSYAAEMAYANLNNDYPNIIWDGYLFNSMTGNDGSQVCS